MDFFDQRHYKICKSYAYHVGLWPYRSKSETTAINIIIFVIFIVQTIPKIIAMTVYSDDAEKLLDVFPLFAVDVIAASKYINLLYRMNMHACGLFAVVGHRLEHSDKSKINNDNPHYASITCKDPDVRHVITCIKSHSEAIQFAVLLESTYMWCFAFVILANFPMMSVTAYQDFNYCSIYSFNSTSHAVSSVVNMDFFDQRYYRFTKSVVISVGRWPYHDGTWWNTLMKGVYYFMFLAQVMPKVFCIMLYSDDGDMMLNLVAPFATDLMSIVKYTNLILKRPAYLALLEELRKDWKTLLNEEEKQILSKYAETGRLLVIGYVWAAIITTFLFVIEPMIPKFQSMIFRTNLSDEDNYKFAVPMEFLIIDQEKYYWPLVTFSGVCIFMIIFGIVSSDVIFTICLQHVCGLFAVVGHRLEHFELEETNPENVKYYPPMEHKDRDFQRMTKSIETHTHAIRYSEAIEETFKWCFAVLVLANMPNLSVTAVMLMEPGISTQLAMKYITFILAQMLHLFYDFYLSEQLMDHSGRITEYITHGKWYDQSKNTKNLLRFMMMRSERVCYLTTGKIFVLSIENYGKFIKTAVSYFTVLAVIVHSNDISLLLETVAPFAGNIISLVKFFNMVYRKEALTILLLRMERDWKTLINEDEINILKEYAETGRKLVLAYTAGCYITVLLYVSEPVIPKFQQILFGKNITPEEDFNFCIAAIIAALISSDLMFIVFLQHVCALFAIVGHRLENFDNEETLPDNIKYYPPMEHKDTDMQRITKCVVSHNEAFKFAHLLEETYIWCFGIVVMMELPMLSVAAVMLMKPNNTIQQYIKHGTFVLAQLSHLFFDFYLSQKLMDHSARLQDLLFNGKWYNLSNKLKMLLLFIIMRSQIPLYLTAGKFLILSIENYGAFIKTSASYFTVILSTQ
ncbi:uncharacterized protein [Chelonus insularis]|uniref:uncharacterized protein n=1 Tax=Chelonus insularis TaxID=460826 RepID=UPI00158B315E|nr:uncharacterized protein LOC118066446 [Chelonus insularis]